MIIRDIFQKPVDRPIEGVIKADDDSHLSNELHEYIVTNEVTKHLTTFFEAYNTGANSSGAWISGFFGSGKSHLLKMLSLALENRKIGDEKAGEIFAAKLDHHPMLKAEVEKATRIPSRSILFNIDQKSDIISKQEVDAILSVFLKVFNEMQGFYPKQPYIAQFERDLHKKGQLESFKQAFQEAAGEPWEDGRETAHGLDAEPFAQAYSQVTGNSTEEGLKVLDRYYETHTVSIESFADMVNEFIETQGKDFRLNFFVDEVGQFIADSSKLMVNLQTISESLSTRCKGRAWIIVTSQEDMTTVVGDMAKIHTSTDFSKIQDRFKTRLPLTSQDVSEVIQKRLLAKKDDTSIQDDLNKLYDTEKANFRTLFEFGDGSRTYKTFSSQESFSSSYPFLPYHYDLFQEAINGLSRGNAFTGKHASVGERSMLGVFQEVAKHIANKEFGTLATFDLMFEGIRSVIKAEHQQAIHSAERNLANDNAIRVLKALFLVKFIPKSFKGSIRNIAILMIERFDVDLAQHTKTIQEALNLLEQNTYIQRTGELYEFLTDDEKDIENEIKAVDSDEAELTAIASRIIYDEILRDTKIRHESNQQDYTFTRKLDEASHGREHELCIHVISPMHEQHGETQSLVARAMGRPELLLYLPSDNRLISDLTLYFKTDRYTRQNNNSSLPDSKRRILAEKGQQNIARKNAIADRIRELLSKAPAYIEGAELSGIGTEPRSRMISAFQQLLRQAYPNLKFLQGNFKEDSAKKILTTDGDDLVRSDDSSLSEAETDMLTHIRRREKNGERPSISTLLQHYAARPYGWYQAATLAVIAKLFMRGKVELRADSNILEKGQVLDHLSNSRHFTNTMVVIQEEFDTAAIQRIKRFHQELFDESNPATEAKDTASRFLEKLRQTITELSELAKRTDSFPFVAKLEKPLESMRKWSEKSYTVFLKDLTEIEDDWLDAKEDIIAPIRSFIHGQQGQTYLDLQTFFKDNRANLSDIDPDQTDQLEQLLASDSPYHGGTLQQAKQIKEALAKTVESELRAAKDEAVAKTISTADHLNTLDGYAELTASQQSELQKTSDRALDEIRSAKLLAVVRDKLQRYTTDGYQSQVKLLNRFNQDNSQAAASNSEDQHSNVVKEAPATYVTRRELQVDFAKKTIESTEDLDAYLQAIRTAYSQALTNNQKITL